MYKQHVTPRWLIWQGGVSVQKYGTTNNWFRMYQCSIAEITLGLHSSTGIFFLQIFITYWLCWWLNTSHSNSSSFAIQRSIRTGLALCGDPQRFENFTLKSVICLAHSDEISKKCFTPIQTSVPECVVKALCFVKQFTLSQPKLWIVIWTLGLY